MPIIRYSERFQSTLRRLTVEDMISEAVVGNPILLNGSDVRTKLGEYSPNGDKVAVIVRRGLPEDGTYLGSLLVYRTAELLDSPDPNLIAQFRSAGNYQPISMPRWTSDDTLVFAATSVRDGTQVYRADLGSGRLTQLTTEKQQMLTFDTSRFGETLAAAVKHLPASLEKDPACISNGCRIQEYNYNTATQWVNPIFGASNMVVYDFNSDERREFPGPYLKLRNSRNYDWCYETFLGGLAPNGKFVIQVCMKRSWPSWWGEYGADPEFQSILRGSGKTYVSELAIVDLTNGEAWPLTGTPHPWSSPDPIWLDNGNTVLLVGAFAPLGDVEGPERESRAANWGVLVIDTATRNAEPVVYFDDAVMNISAAVWDEQAQTLKVALLDENRESLPDLRVHRNGDTWSVLETSEIHEDVVGTDSGKGLPLAIEQNLNQRPILVAKDPQSGGRNVILDPNPWLDDVKLGQVEKVTWETTGGYVWTGGLYYPPDYEQGKRYPMVLQTHGFSSETFSLHGYTRNYAAQPLAARGIIVLQMDDGRIDGRSIIRSKVGGTPSEWPVFKAGHEGAIDYLDRRGLIDRMRVGIVGWSRTGQHMAYTLTHSSYPFAAGAFTDTGMYGLWYYLFDGARPFIESTLGGLPVGVTLESWLEHSPSFQLERIQSPMLMWTQSGPWVLWDWYTGLRRLEKPVEYWVLPDGMHQVYKVTERLNVNTLYVDWFDFWLNGHEDRDPRKAAQYARWREYREQQRRVLSEPRPPLLDWQATPIPETAEPPRLTN